METPWNIRSAERRSEKYHRRNPHYCQKLRQSHFSSKNQAWRQDVSYFDILQSDSRFESSSDISNLRDFYDAIEINVRNLKTLGTTSESFAPLIIPTILSKIPEDICHEVIKINRDCEKFQNEVVSIE